MFCNSINWSTKTVQRLKLLVYTELTTYENSFTVILNTNNIVELLSSNIYS